MKRSGTGRSILLGLVILCMLGVVWLRARGGVLPFAPAPAATPEPTVEPVPTPEPTPPFVEPVMREGGPVTFDGVLLDTPALYQEDIPFVKLSEAAKAIGVTVSHEPGSEVFEFDWRKSRVVLRSGSDTLEYLGGVSALSAGPLLCSGGDDLLVPVESFCAGAQIGYLYDGEFDHIYCTPAAGNWDVEPGHTVPVMMYHGVGWGPEEANLFVDTRNMEEQIVDLLENGYTPIWFEDLEHVEDYEKPILLTYDDGWSNNYTDLLPLLEQYHVKATVFVVIDFFPEGGSHLTEEQAMEMYESGWVSLQSHTMSHTDLTWLMPEQQEYELSQSRLYLTRMTGKEPCALSYPIGGSNAAIEALASQYYHFAVKMTRYEPYNTTEDPMLIYRFFPERYTQMWQYEEWLQRPSLFDEPEPADA